MQSRLEPPVHRGDLCVWPGCRGDPLTGWLTASSAPPEYESTEVTPALLDDSDFPFHGECRFALTLVWIHGMAQYQEYFFIGFLLFHYRSTLPCQNSGGKGQCDTLYISLSLSPSWLFQPATQNFFLHFTMQVRFSTQRVSCASWQYKNKTHWKSNRKAKKNRWINLTSATVVQWSIKKRQEKRGLLLRPLLLDIFTSSYYATKD